jgi:hypothetical protein
VFDMLKSLFPIKDPVFVFCPVRRYCQILSDTVRYCQILSGTVRYCQILSDTVRYCQILSDTVRYCQILSDTVRYCQVLSDTCVNLFIYFILATKKLFFPTFDLALMNTHAKTCLLLPQHGSTSIRSYFLYSIECISINIR